MVAGLINKIRMSLAKQRERRSGAGARMARLLNEEEEDEFYATTYGGFQETEDDNEYKYGSIWSWDFKV